MYVQALYVADINVCQTRRQNVAIVALALRQAVVHGEFCCAKILGCSG